MALWAKVTQLQGDALKQLQHLYNEQLPLEVRHACADWLEEQPWQRIDMDDPTHEDYARKLLERLLEECHNKLASEPMFPVKVKLQEYITSLQNIYLRNPMYLVSVIRNIFKTETEVIQHAENPQLKLEPTMPMRSDVHRTLAQQFEDLNLRIQDNDNDIHHIQQELESFIIQYQEGVYLSQQLHHITTTPNGTSNHENIRHLNDRKIIVEQQMQQNLHGMRQRKKEVIDKFQETIRKLITLQSQVLDNELEKWKRQQQLAGNGAPWDNNLDQIQQWCENLADIVWKTRQQIKLCESTWNQVPFEENADNSLPTLYQQISGLLSTLVMSTFVIERQPPQVMKTNTRFSATVRLLVGGRLSVHMIPPEVKATIISEAQANAFLHQNDKMIKGSCSGEILNNSGTMEYHQATRQLSINFRNMQLRKIKRTEKKGTESVTEEKFALLFQSQFKVGAGDVVFNVWTLSLPVVVIVHGVQEPNAWATVVWDNAFSEKGRVPFVVPEKVSWTQVAEALNCKFKAAVGRGLSDEHLRFLAGKAIHWLHSDDFNPILLSRSQFMKDSLPNRNFTFWEWFYAILKLTKEHLQALWNDGAVHGFLTRSQAQSVLVQKPYGTFLLRFSDSELGGITIAWVAEGKAGPEVFLVQPFTSKDFAIRSLADRIGDLEHMIYLYPDLPKDQVFGKYYTQSKEDTVPTANGYVKPLLVNTLRLPGNGIDALSASSQPLSPENNSFQDPNCSSLSDALTNDSFDMEMEFLNEDWPHLVIKDILENKP